MTRINCVPPSMLSDQHLLASWKEYPRIITAVEKLIEKGKTVDDVDIPEKYTFGAGHCKFFYDKLGTLYLSINDVYSAMRNRGMNPKESIMKSIHERMFKGNIDRSWRGIWVPDKQDIYINMARLVERNFKTKMRVEGRNIVEEFDV